MSQATIDQIVREIQALSEEDRLVLDRRLAELNEAEWQRQTAEARRIARLEGITQETIDRTIEKMRYG